jgi:S1-C subfamily serine protease
MAPLALLQAKGIVVVSVLNGSLADTMGILPGDVILAVNGAEAGDLPHFTQLIHSVAVNTFTVWRKGKSLELTVPQSM